MPACPRTVRVAAFACLTGVAGCSTYRLEPLPPEQRRAQATVPGSTPDAPTDAPPVNPPGSNQPGSNQPGSSPPASTGAVTMLLDPVDCPVCADMLAGRLRAVPGVGTVAIDHGAGRVVVTPRAGSGVSAQAVRAQAEAANFVVRSVEMQR